MALISLFPPSNECLAAFPQVLVSGCPPVPNPILESQELQSFSLFPTIPILALEDLFPNTALNPSLLQCFCNEACEPIIFFQVPRPSEMLR